MIHFNVFSTIPVLTANVSNQNALSIHQCPEIHPNRSIRQHSGTILFSSPLSIAPNCCGSDWIKRPHQWPEGITCNYVCSWVTVHVPTLNWAGLALEKKRWEENAAHGIHKVRIILEYFSSLVSSKELELHYHPQLHSMPFSFPLSIIIERHFLVKVSYYNNVIIFNWLNPRVLIGWISI